LTIETVDSVCGSSKTLTAIAVAVARARDERIPTILAMPTRALIVEMAEVARRQSEVPVTVITSAADDEPPPTGPQRQSSTVKRLTQHLMSSAKGGRITFITHETMFRMGADWSAAASEFELIVDEAPEVILARAPFLLRDSWRILTAFLELGETVTDSPGLRRTRKRLQDTGYKAAITIISERELKLLQAFEQIIAGGPQASSLGEWQQARDRAEPLRAKAREAVAAVEAVTDNDPGLRPYCILRTHSPKRVQRRITLMPVDDVYRLLHPVPLWLKQQTQLFVEWESRVRLLAGQGVGPQRGKVSICGFRRPDALRSFRRVTMLGALLQHSLTWHVWDSLGVRFAPSQLIKLAQTTTRLGPRRLRIYWLSDEGWSKRLRDRSGGIDAILAAIAQAGVVDQRQPVCVQVNRDDGSEENPTVVRPFFPLAQVMPHKVEGQNRFRGIHQLIHCAALNSCTPDIRFLETVLGIDSREQRIARTGYAVYQALMRLSLRDPTGKDDVTLVVMDQDVAEWLKQWFTPGEQVVVAKLNTDVIRSKGKPGRPRKLDALTNAQRQQRWRERHR
jgi:hypothetical protein